MKLFLSPLLFNFKMRKHQPELNLKNRKCTLLSCNKNHFLVWWTIGLEHSFHHCFLVNDSPPIKSHYLPDAMCVPGSEDFKLTFLRHWNKVGIAFFFNCRLLTYPGRKQLFSKWSEQSKWCGEGLKSGWQIARIHRLQSFGLLRGNLWMN